MKDNFFFIDEKVAMTQRLIYFILALLLNASFLRATLLEEVPVSYEGRFRPSKAYAQLWLYEIYHDSAFKKAHRSSFQVEDDSPLNFLWRLHVKGSRSFQLSPLFWIGSAQLKQRLGLDPLRLHFHYNELQTAVYQDPKTSKAIFQLFLNYYFFKAYQQPSNRSHTDLLELKDWSPGLWVYLKKDDLQLRSLPSSFPWSAHVQVNDRFPFNFKKSQEKLTQDLQKLLLSLKQFESLMETKPPIENLYQTYLIHLQTIKTAPKEIEQALEQRYPLILRLKQAGSLFKMLPSRYQPDEWFSLHALKLTTYQSKLNTTLPVANFTLFSDQDFEAIRQSYLEWENHFLKVQDLNQSSILQNHFLTQLDRAYQTLANQPYQEAHGKTLFFPSRAQLKWERLYYQLPLIPIALSLYSLAILALMFTYYLHSKSFNYFSFSLLALAFIFHTGILILRCYILDRPPVSNMFETVIYVPWIAMLTGLILRYFFRYQFILIAAALSSIVLLILLQITSLNHSLENVQAVLDSQFWLIIHVLMVVGSYGVFILGGILGHFYLALLAWRKKETAQMKIMADAIGQTLYLGTALLIFGTILGGIWAAESWGRFWDWDPKESWAFISSCVYLIWIHAYRFRQISHFGLAVGSIVGLLMISFTWYGVNYILGTGLHSYGFGSGGDVYYYLFIILEGLFLIYIGYIKQQIKNYHLT